tara:strand:- start:540 stop:725 length:186 start_codon:yes stop_codon:yes gene_type:complete
MSNNDEKEMRDVLLQMRFEKEDMLMELDNRNKESRCGSLFCMIFYIICAAVLSYMSYIHDS